MSAMTDCIFCKIVNEDIPNEYKVYEDEYFIAFLDLRPVTKGHLLLIPKKHYETLLDIPDEDLKNLIIATKKVSKALSLSIGNGDYNIIMNNGKLAGQIVAHAHVHIIPRFKGDRLRIKWSHKKYIGKQMKEIQDNIKKFV